MARLFTGLEIDPALALELSLARGGLAGARWVEPEDYHITLRFVGEVDGALAREIDAELRRVRARAFDLAIARIGSFGGERPRAIVALIDPSAPLERLQGELEALMRRLGLAPETRKFTPHITLARLKGVTADAVATYLAGVSVFPRRKIAARRVTLYSSRTSRGGGPYVAEAVYPLD